MKKICKGLRNFVIMGIVASMVLLMPLQSLAEEASSVADMEETMESSTAKADEETSKAENDVLKESEPAAEGESDVPETVGQYADESSSDESTDATDESTDATDESESEGEAETVPGVVYRTQVQDYGWKDWVRDGELGGTAGEAKRLETIQISLENAKESGEIKYQAQVQDIGWQSSVGNGQIAGTVGQAKRLEAIKIWLTGELGEKYDIYYCVHVRNVGWLDWARNGEVAGTVGLALRVEGIKIKLVKKGEAAPGKVGDSCIIKPTLTYRTYMQDYGWRSWVNEDTASDGLGLARRMESFQINLNKDTDSSLGSIRYRAYCQDYGWKPWVENGKIAGTMGESKRTEAIQVELTGRLAEICDVYYRVYCQDYGWLGWTKNGGTAGTAGFALRIEGIQVRIVSKAATPITCGGSYRQYTGPGYYVIGATKYYYYGVGARRSGTGWTRVNGDRYYMVDGCYLTGWHYIDGYKYYFYGDGRLCQNVDSIIGAQSRYVIKVNKAMNCVTVYASDGANGYIIPVKSMLCSVGDDTPIGTFYTPVKYRWRAMINGTYAQYATRLTAGQGFLFHSITYESRNNRTLLTIGYNNLGINRSAGCIRLVCGEAYWVYTRCVIGTQVTIYNDTSAPGPFDRPTVIPIPADQRWDPTDPNL